MEVLRLEIYQESACYKKPFAYKVTETYPLPPHSTVKGMLHSILNSKGILQDMLSEKEVEYLPMQISIQGTYENVFNSYNTMYFYKSKDVTTMPLNTHMLFGVNLVIHVKAPKEILEKLLECIKSANEYFSLGRREDLALINKAEIVEVREVDVYEEYEDANLIVNKSIYIPKDKLPCKLGGINYRLNWKYDIVNDIRQWEKIDVLYVDVGAEIDEGIVLMDKYEDIMFFN